MACLLYCCTFIFGFKINSILMWKLLIYRKIILVIWIVNIHWMCIYTGNDLYRRSLWLISQCRSSNSYWIIRIDGLLERTFLIQYNSININFVKLLFYVKLLKEDCACIYMLLFHYSVPFQFKQDIMTWGWNYMLRKVESETKFVKSSQSI